MPMEKMDKLYLDEFLSMKYNRMTDEKDEAKEKERFAALKEYATEIELREVINRKVFMLKNKLIYGEDSSALDFNYRP
jgi:hypothetical protein